MEEGLLADPDVICMLAFFGVERPEYYSPTPEDGAKMALIVLEEKKLTTSSAVVLKAIADEARRLKTLPPLQEPGSIPADILRIAIYDVGLEKTKLRGR